MIGHFVFVDHCLGELDAPGDPLFAQPVVVKRLHDLGGYTFGCRLREIWNVLLTEVDRRIRKVEVNQGGPAGDHLVTHEARVGWR